MPWRTATRMLKPSDDGLKTPWPKSAFVWMNPPYGGHKNSPTSQHRWMEKRRAWQRDCPCAGADGNELDAGVGAQPPQRFSGGVHEGASVVLPPGWDPGHELPGGIGVHRLRCCSRAQAQAGVESGLIRGTYLDMAHVSRVAGADVGRLTMNKRTPKKAKPTSRRNNATSGC